MTTINDTSLRLLFAKNFAKFVEDNSLVPIRGSKELEEVLSTSDVTETSDPNVWRGHKCKFYGVAFHTWVPNKAPGRLSTNISYDGMIKVYSPKFIQIYYRMKADSGLNSYENVYFDSFINALMFVDLHFVKNDRRAAYQIKGKTNI